MRPKSPLDAQNAPGQLLGGGARDLRNRFINVAHDRVMNFLSDYLSGTHRTRVVSNAACLTRRVVGGGLGLRAALRAISRRIVGLLGG
jgi:hypothetical protein